MSRYYPVLRLGAVLSALTALTILACLAFLPDASYAPSGAAAGPTLPRLLVVAALTAFLAAWVSLEVLIKRCAAEEAKVVPRCVRSLLDTLSEGVVILDTEQRIAMANDAFARNVDRRAAELEGHKLSEFSWGQPNAEQGRVDYPWVQSIARGVSQVGTVLHLWTDVNRPRLFRANTSPVRGSNGTTRGALVTFSDLTPIEKKNAQMRRLLDKLRRSRAQVQQHNQELRAQATRDPLTSCLNRRALFVEFETLWSTAIRYGHPLSCLMVDIDHFKAINDTHGHGVGDRVLQQVGEVLVALARKGDRICRYGGEEFCVLLPHIDLEEATTVAERYCGEIAARDFGAVKVTASVGVSAIGLQAREPAELLEQADKALYAAKRAGRNRWARWDRLPASLAREPSRAGHPTAAPWMSNSVPYPAVSVLFTALSHRHAETAAHCRRVADLCAATGQGLLPPTRGYILEVAALLHDVGKLSVPDAVLLKPGPLNDDEREVFRVQERLGEKLIMEAFNSEELNLIVRNYRAWFGGNPLQPELPVGAAIPITARLLAIADAYDAMISDRVYCKGRSREEAFAELRRCAGVQFDPELVERFIRVVSEREAHKESPARRSSGTIPRVQAAAATSLCSV
jgi:diguanylate cyclase (GGDEF)-like protein